MKYKAWHPAFADAFMFPERLSALKHIYHLLPAGVCRVLLRIFCFPLYAPGVNGMAPAEPGKQYLDRFMLSAPLHTTHFIILIRLADASCLI